TITDQGGNTATCSATVNVIFSPQNAQLCQNITVNLNNQGTAAIIPADVFLGGGNECGGFSPLSVTPHSFTCSNVGANTVTLTVSEIGGATTTCSATVTIADTTPPDVQCQNTSVFLDQNGAITLGVAQINNGTTDNCTLQNLTIEPAVLTCEQLGSATVTLTATDQSGNTATCAATVLVTDAIAPTLSCNNATVAINISGSVSITPQMVISSAADNCGIVFTGVLPHTFTCANVGSNTVVATVADAQGNTATCSAVVNVLFNAPPELLCQEATVNLGATGTATIAPVDVFAGSPDDCSLLIPVSVSPSVVTCAQLSGTTVTLTVSDTGGNTTTCSANIIVTDATPPTAQCQNTLVNLNSSGTATLTAGMVTNNSFDNCSISSLSVFPEQFTCANLGSNTVTLTATDQSGNTATCQATVTVADNLAPTITCANTTLEITTQNSVSVLPTMITGSAADNCGINTTSVLPNTFTCQNVGNNTVTLTVTDTSGNTSTCNATVSVLFNPPPVSVCQPASVSLGSNGTATLSPMSVFAGGSDVCGLLSPVSVNPALFTCANLGSNTVTLTVANNIGFTYTCQATVTVTDNLPPTAQCQNAWVNLNGSGTATLTSGMVNNNSFDNCSISSLSVFPEQFTCANLGNNTITLTATDQSGNSATCNATLLVADAVPPQVSCANISVDITATGSATITPASVTASASDNCQVSGFSLSATTFNCANVGSNTITLTATDQSGNTATCQAQVTVVFNPPVISSLCQNYATNLNQSGTAAILPVHVFGGGADLCGGITPVSVLPNTFTCANVGSNTVTLTTVNSVGNSSTCSATVTITDQIPPQITCPPNINTTTQPNLCGANLTITPPTPADNCSIIALTNSVTGNANASGFYPGGITTVVYTTVDASGNTDTCSFNINITDNQPPVFTCPPNMVKSAADCFEPFNWTTPTASDNCGVVSVLPDSPSGSLFGIGATTITYTATDVWGNTATCSFTATLNDVTPPDLVCPQNINLSTQGQTCQATATWAVPSPTDNCSAVSLTNASHMPGAIFNTGTVTVSYAAADSWNNTSSCTFTITVADTTPPFIDCPGNKTLPTTPGTCHAFVTVDDFFASDNCGALTVINNINGTNDAGGIYPLGATTVTYLATDAVGNTNICTFNITIFDAQAPAVTCPANVVQPLSGANCFAIVTVPPATATDNCLGVVALSNSLTGTANASGAYLVGVTTVTYTAADVAGNTVTCNFTVSVLEQTPPVIAACPPNISKPVVAGTCSATATWNTPVATDNCSVVTLSVSVPSGSSFNTGVSTVTYTATDASGNTATCAFTVTVLDPNPPAITCPANMVSCSTFPFWPSATATDDCLVIGVVANKPQGAYMAPGINTVTFTATDASGNTATCTFSINVAPPLSVILSSSNFGGNNVTCHGASTGIINGVAFGGVSPYSFQWSNGANANILTGLPAGSYTATVTDALGCTGTNSITLTQPPPIVCSMTTSPATCAGIANGSATVSVLGLGIYNYTWSGPSGALPPTATANNLLPGTYHVTVTNPLGCTCVASGTVNSGTATTTLTGNMTTTPAAPPVIFNSSAITFTGGSAPYTFNWVTAGYVQYSASNTGITVIYSGSAFWSVTVSDNNPCTIGELVFSNAPNVNTQILTIVSANVTSDSGGSNGSISLTVAGGNPCAGTAQYQYSWSGPSNWLPVGNTNTPNLTGLPSGWYIVQVKDCGPDGVPNTGDEQTVFAYYWVTKQVRGRGKQPDIGLQVFPNPTQGAFTIGVLLATPEQFNIGLYDFTGRYLATLHQQIEPNQNSQTTVDIDLPPHLPDGLYIVQLTTASGYSMQQKLFVTQNK
ncbi:MAG TPA: HYR domain-containing protein, partial [Chitinophagales bacterium]|nr:HYR domain-containing protein [Chitinophagales bacterium]